MSTPEKVIQPFPVQRGPPFPRRLAGLARGPLRGRLASGSPALRRSGPARSCRGGSGRTGRGAPPRRAGARGTSGLSPTSSRSFVVAALIALETSRLSLSRRAGDVLQAAFPPQRPHPPGAHGGAGSSFADALILPRAGRVSARRRAFRECERRLIYLA